MIPVRRRRHDQLPEVIEHSIHRLAPHRRRLWECAAKLARPYAGQHRPLFRILEVVRDPVDDGMPVPAEFIGLHRHKYRVFTLHATVESGNRIFLAITPN